MKFSCLQENLAKGLGIVVKAIPTKSPLPILHNVLIEAKDGRLKLTASNMDTTISLFVGASVDEEGAITVPARLLNEFVSHLSPSTIEGSLKNSILHLSAKTSKAKFNGVPAADYPQLSDVNESLETLELDPIDFANSINLVGFSASTDDSRPVLGGILLDFSKDVLTLVSADGFRLSEKVLSARGSLDEFKVVVPAKTLLEVARIFSNSDEPIKLVLNTLENQAVFEAKEITVYTRVIDGQFPDYKKLIPEATILNAEFDTQELLEAVKLTNVFAKDVGSIIKVHFNPEGKIKLTSFAQETGENHSEFEAEVTGEMFEVSYNSKYLLDFLNNIKAERLMFGSNGALTPGIIRDAGDTGYIHLIMPVRIES